ncbi:MAG: hypothetical protein K1X94_11850 [Sandaracinaceae bacterium]|nr:hypothetical protein [Sandaracinaceae bacterium]
MRFGALLSSGLRAHALPLPITASTVKRDALRTRAQTVSSASRAAVLGLALPAIAGGCDGSRAPFSVEIVTPAGGDPVSGASAGRLRVLVAQDGQPTRDQGVDLVGGTFQLDVTIASYGVPTRLGVELVRDGTTSLGAVPAFAPVGFPFVRVPVVPRGTCASLGTQRLATPRSGAALVSIDALLLVIGGLDASTQPATDAERFWTPLLTSTEGSATALSTELGVGRARALRLPTTEKLVVVGTARSLVLDLSPDATTLVADLRGLHAGVGERSSLVELAGEGLAIVGGAVGAAGAASVSWMAIDASLDTSALPDPRRDAAASAWGSAQGVLVAGGNGAGAETFLYVPVAEGARGDVIAFGASDDPTRVLTGGFLVRSPDGGAALYVGATDESGAVVHDTLLVTGCPARCEVSAGPAWDDARSGVAFAQTTSGAWLAGGRDDRGPVALVDRITWTGSTPSFVSSSLATAREDASITPLAGGLVVIAGGRGADRPLADLELCAPDALEPL